MTDDGIIPPAALFAEPRRRAGHAFTLVGSWLFSEAMAQLLEAVGQRMPTAEDWRAGDGNNTASWLHLNEDLPPWLESVISDQAAASPGLTKEQTDSLRRALAVERIAANHFNFRGDGSRQYRERSQAVSGNFDPEVRDRILVLTDRLGLVRSRRPRYPSYDKTIVLGGGYRSPLLRARYAAQLRAAGVTLGQLTFLGSPRFLIAEPPERALTDSYAPGATDEFDLMIDGARAELGLAATETTYLCGCASSESPCPKWTDSGLDNAGHTPPAYTHERCVSLIDRARESVGTVLSASTGRPPYRPDTSDTFSLWARRSDPHANERVLVITTQIFVPFQTFDALRRLYLRYGTEVDAVGYGAEWGDRPLTAEYLLQETLSAIRSARRLLVDAAEELMQACAVT